MKNVKKMNKVKKTELVEEIADIDIDEFCSQLDLEVVYKGTRDKLHISTFNINRPGLQLAGYFEHFGEERVQVIGEMEMSYLKTLSDDDASKAIESLFMHNFPCLVLSTNLEPGAAILAAAEKYDRVVLRSSLRTTMIMNELSIFFNELLAPTVTMHGVLMDLYGVGVLITGNSSVGKSETALELIQRNHRLVADDAVVIRRVSDRLVGSSPSVIRYLMEVRGIGIIDIRSMYGSGAVKLTKVIDMVIKLEEWDNDKEYDRLGNVKETYTILDADLPMHTVPVKPGRNLAVILEVAARNYRLKSMGYDTLEELDKRIKNRENGEKELLF